MLVLDEQKILSNFVDSIASKATKQSYLYGLKFFMKFLKIEKYSELLTLPIHDSVRSFIVWMKGEGYSTRSIKVKVFAIKAFYEMNDIENIKWKKLMKYKGEESDVHEDRGYSHEEIQQILNVCDLRTKCAILLMSSSGMRIGALPLLAIRDMGIHKKDRENSSYDYKSDTSAATITVYSKTKDKYISFITPECHKAIDDYLDYRKRCGEIITPNSPLLRKDFNSDLARFKVEPTTNNSLAKSIWKAVVKSGLREIDHVNAERKDIMLNHGFRKFFKTQLVLAKVDSEIREMLMGHSKRRIEIVYNKLTTEEIYEEYSKAVDLLTIDPSKRLQRKVEMLTVEKSKIDQALAAIEEVKRKVGL